MNQPYAQRFADQELYPMWSALPALTDHADPFVYEQRVAVYKLLIDSMNERGVFGAENEWNVFWGYVFQLEWQWRSGRLQLADTPPGRIDPNSMWGYANYSLSVIPYIAAAQLGIAPADRVSAARTPRARSNTRSAAARRAPIRFRRSSMRRMRDWREFFEFVQQFEPGKDIEPIRLIQWKAHNASLEAVEPGVFALGARHLLPSERGFPARLDSHGRFSRDRLPGAPT